MIKYKAKSKDCLLTVKVKLPSNSSLNERELDFFSRKLLRGFFKPQVVKKTLIAYTGPIGISLYDRLQKPIGKYDFFFIMEQIVDATLKLQKNGLPWNKVVWNLHHSFINETTKEVQFLFLPLEQPREDDRVMTFIENLIYSAKPYDEHDLNFVSRFVYFIKSLSGYDPNRIEAYIMQEDRSVVNTIKKHATGGSGFMTDKPKDYYDHYEQKRTNTDDEATGLLSDDDEATGLLDEEEATRLLSESEDTALLVDDSDEATGLLVENDGVMAEEKSNVANVHFPTLYRVLTDERISVNKPVFRLGKEKSYVDYFVTNNIAVSRSHADVITRGNKYYVRDLNSKNHTYINDRIIPIQIEVEIHNGDRIKLGNEEFVFNI